MDTNTLVTKFLTHTYTKAESLRRIRVVKDFINHILFIDTDKKSFDEQLASYQQKTILPLNEVDQAWMKELGSEFFQVFSPSGTESNVTTSSKEYKPSTTIFRELEAAIQKAPIVTIYLAFSPSAADLQPVNDWIKKELGPAMLYEINYNTQLIGGCAFSYKGIYKDFSLKNKIDANKQIVLKTLGEYKR